MNAAQQAAASAINMNPLMNVLTFPSFNGVAAGSDTTLDIPAGPLYKRIIIEYSGVTLAQLKNIQVKQNGTAFQTYRDGAELDKLNQYFRHDAAAGYLVIDFEDFDAFTLGGLDAYAWQTNPAASNFSTGQIQISIDAAAAAPKLKAYYVAPQVNDLKPRRVRTVRTFDYNAPAIGDFEISDLPKGGRYDQIGRVFFHNANIGNLKLRINNTDQFDISEALNDYIQEGVKRVPDASTFVFDPSAVSGRRTGAIVSTLGASDLRFILNMSATGSVPISVEYREVLA